MVECYAIESAERPGLFFSNAYNWSAAIHKALFYKTPKDARDMAERRGQPYKIVKFTIQEAE